ncbi:MAG: hypothetical protein WC565_06700 [Parcubacteria group bacterium]
MSQSEHFIEGFPARDLRDAMNLYGLPGVADVVALEDLRGDGIEGDAANAAAAALGRIVSLAERRNCLSGQGQFNLWLASRPDTSIAMTGDGLERDTCSADELIDYIGAVAMGIDVFALDADELGDDSALDSDEDFYRLAADALIGGCSQAELMSLGWDPFKAVKKAVKKVSKPLKKVASVAMKPVTVFTKPLAKLATKAVAKLPAKYRGLGNAVIKSAVSLTNPATMFNPKTLIKDQIALTKASLPIAKTLVKSPIVKTIVGGAAIVFPPLGVPAAAALATASAIANAVDSKLPGVRAAAQQVVGNTFKVIAAGKKAPPNSQAAQDAKGAEIALAQIAQAKKAQTLTKAAKPSAPGARRFIHEVGPTGRITRVMI